MKRSFLVVVGVGFFCFGTTQAQSVTIPDPNFLTFLQNSDVAGCLTGNQLDAGCPAVVNKTYLDCSNMSIADLTGLEAFVNLEGLTCNNNGLTSLPSLPPLLTVMFCTDNQLTALPNLPTSITGLYCNNNQLTTLPTLPASITEIVCTHNQISTLPSLPASLMYLTCDHNQLTALPNLPASLAALQCMFNQLTALPSLPNSLTGLYLNTNHVTTLPNLPASLEILDCSFNPLPTLPSLPASLTALHCAADLLTTLPSLPVSLQILNCWNNQLISLPNLPDSLVALNCFDNQIASLPNLPASLTYLRCDINQLTALPSLPDSLTELKCGNNQLSALPALPAVMSYLDISNNPGITCLPPLEKLTGSASNSSIANTGITCLPNIIQHSGSIPSIDALPLCDVFGNGCQVAWNIAGHVYRDDNINCVADNAEPNIQNIKLELAQGGTVEQQVYANGAGNFSFDTDLGTYTTRVDTTGLPFVVSCPGNNARTSSLIPTDSLDYGADFALQCKPGYDLTIQSIAHTGGMFFPAHQATVSIQAGDLVKYYGATCNTQGLSGTVTATFNGPVSLVSASGNGTTGGNAVTWSVSDFSQLSFFNDFSVTFIVDTVPATNFMCIDVSIASNTGTDNNPSNNTLTQCFSVVNSFDPNYKEVYPTHIAQAGDWHTYTVHFQNTGTAPAQHIRVIDTLDQNLDASSFQLLAYSHPNLTQVKGNVVYFNFPNINLPDSNSNEPDSHGWIQYKIKTNSNVNPLTTTIHNTASIYFDFNSPVQTNDAIVEPLSGVASVAQVDFTLSPNPANDMVAVSFPSACKNALVVVTDVTGRKLMQQNISNGTTAQLQLSRFAAGTYFVQLTSADKTVAVKKLVIVR